MKNFAFSMILLAGIAAYANAAKLYIVTWGNIQAAQIGGYVVINWQTLDETDNDYMVIERSNDSVIFTPIQSVGAIGDSNIPTNYSFTDSTANINQTYYYRIKQIDLDGSFTYSDIATYNPFAGIENNYLKNSLKVFPNPASNFTTLQWSADLIGDYEMKLTDMNGQQIFTQQVTNTYICLVNLTNLPTGNYIFQLYYQHIMVHSEIITKAD